MKPTTNISMIFALALAAGCTTEPADGAGGDEGGDLAGDELRALDAAGQYHIQSKFDLAASVPGTAGAVVNKIIEITDDPEDPTLWVVDQALAAMPSGYVKTALQTVKPYVVGYLNDRLLDLAPDFFPIAVQLANDFGQMAKSFGVIETMNVSGAPGAFASQVTVVGAHFAIDGVESDHAFADHGGAAIAAGGAAVTLAAGKLGIGEHGYALSYGKVLRLGLDAAIVPMFEPSAHSLNELFAAKVNCPLIGKAIAAAVGVGSASAYASYCTAGLNRGADFIYSKIAEVDGVALQFSVAGSARAFDKDRDGGVDTLTGGEWTGTVKFGGSAPAPLAGATFFGARM